MNTLIVRLAELEIVPGQIESFKSAGIENISHSLSSEPGVLEFHAVIKREPPGVVFILEVYADLQAYEAHRQSAHFKAFSATVASMVKTRSLCEVIPVVLGSKPQPYALNPHVRIAELDIEIAQIEAYKRARKPPRFALKGQRN